jgi:hypothetical protein
MLRVTFIFLILSLAGCATSSLPDQCEPVYLSDDTPNVTPRDLEGLDKEKQIKVFKTIKYLHMWGVSNFQRVKTICDKQEQ